jgi:tRNA-specific 2-thiouridylase
MSKAIVMISGGLDSLLTMKLTAALGADVLGLHFYTSFSRKSLEETRDKFSFISQRLGLAIEVIDIRKEFLEVVKNPRWGYGSNLNPCIDCKAYMFKCAAGILSERGFDFVTSGEVLGQRPMSQYKDAMRRIEQASGLEGMIVRPLCGKLLDATIPEKQGLIDREKLLDINGRARTRQFALAKELGIEDYPWPGGGCLLTEPNFCSRLSDLISHEGLSESGVELIKSGRHFRLTPLCRLVMGRNHDDNNRIMALAGEGDFVIVPDNVPGPCALAHGEITEEIKALSLGIVARYTIDEGELTLIARYAGREETIMVTPGDMAYAKGVLIK